MDPLTLQYSHEPLSWPGLMTYTVLGTVYLRIKIGPPRVWGEWYRSTSLDLHTNPAWLGAAFTQVILLIRATVVLAWPWMLAADLADGALRVIRAVARHVHVVRYHHAQTCSHRDPCCHVHPCDCESDEEEEEGEEDDEDCDCPDCVDEDERDRRWWRWW